MTVRPQGYRVAVVGASSLVGKELLAVLKERAFPVARLITAEPEEGEMELPVMDLRAGFQPVMADAGLSEADLEFIFVAALPRQPSGENMEGGTGWPAFLRSPAELAASTHAKVIDLSEGLAGEAGGQLRVPWLEEAGRTAAPSAGKPAAPRFFISPHPAAIALSTLLLRLGKRSQVRKAVAQIFLPASEFGSLGVEELQKQTVALLSFQKIPHAVFGQQLAFNLLSRFSPSAGGHADLTLAGLESRIQDQVRGLLGKGAPLPALRVIQAPVFHSLAFSVYVETAERTAPEELARALAGAHVELRRHKDGAPSQVAAAGADDILVDSLTPDALCPQGVWIWAVVDNLRLAAANAVEIAEKAGAEPVAGES
jgi:aspartate-semialdehyde dehydrogenase